MRTAHFAAFDSRLKARVPALAALTFDGEATLSDGTVRKGTFLVEHDMGFDGQDDGRLAVNVSDVADGTYRVVVRVVADTRAAVRSVADVVTSGMVGQVLTVAGRVCGAVEKDQGPDGIEVDGYSRYADLDFIWRSQRA